MFKSLRILFLSLALLGGLTDAALADRPWRDRGPNRDRQYDDEGRHRDRSRGGERGREFGEDRQRERLISLDQAVAMAERRFGARVVRTETHQEGGRTVYRLRLMSDNRVWTVTVDAATGSMR